jgi:hypothetical protein
MQRRSIRKEGQVSLLDLSGRKGGYVREVVERVIEDYLNALDAKNEQRKLDLQEQLNEILIRQEAAIAAAEERKKLFKYRIGAVAFTLVGLTLTTFFTIFLVYLVANPQTGFDLPESSLNWLISSSIAQVGAIAVVAYRWLFRDVGKSEG